MLTIKGSIEMDAIIMEGNTLKTGMRKSSAQFSRI